jgi:type II secretory pathway component PulK
MKFSAASLFQRNATRRAFRKSSALIITLAFVAVLTVLLLAFLSRAGVERQIAGASASEMKADQIAKAGLDIIVTDFRQEISAGSSVTANTTANPTWPAIYLPTSAYTSVPARILTTGELNPTTGLFNLVRRS